MHPRLQRTLDLLTGRHRNTLRAVPTITGHWGWTTTCHTCDTTHTGTAPTRRDALTQAHRGLGPRDHHTVDRTRTADADTHLSRHLTDHGHPPLRAWTDLRRATLPAELTGTGYTVATDGSYNHNTGKAAWGFITDTGWCSHGRLRGTIPATDRQHGPNAAELAAVRRALPLFPDRSTITLLIDSVRVGVLIQDLAELTAADGDFKTFRTPYWANRHTVAEIREYLRHSHSTLRLLWTRSNTNPLHNYADTLARAANNYRPKDPAWQPRDIEPIGTGCAPTCTLIHTATPTAYTRPSG